MEWLTTPACPSLMCSFNRGNIEGTNSLKICFNVCVYMFFMFVLGLVLRMRRVLKCTYAYDRV